MSKIFCNLWQEALRSRQQAGILLSHELPKLTIVPNRTKYYHNRHRDPKCPKYIPEFDQIHKDDKELTPDQVRAKLHEKGIAPLSNWNEREMCFMLSINDTYKPPNSDGKFSSLLNNGKSPLSSVKEPKSSEELSSPKGGEKGPVKFTTSEAHINYKATRNFYGEDRDLPDSHNVMLASTGILGLFYLFFLRDDIDADGGLALAKPVYETVPELAIPLLQAAIAENKKFGNDTQKLEKKLAEYMEDPEKHGGYRHKLIEN